MFRCPGMSIWPLPPGYSQAHKRMWLSVQAQNSNQYPRVHLEDQAELGIQLQDGTKFDSINGSNNKTVCFPWHVGAGESQKPSSPQNNTEDPSRT